MVQHIVLVIVAALVFSCTQNQHAGRPGVDETSNGITAKITLADSTPAFEARLHVSPCEFASKSIEDLTANAHGLAIIDTSSHDSTLCITAVDSGQTALGIYHRGDRDTLRLTLAPFARLRGQVVLPAKATRAIVQIFGIPLTVITDPNGFFEFDSLPAGTLQIRAILPDTNVVIGESKVTVEPGKTSVGVVLVPVIGDLSALPYSEIVQFNTTKTGASLTEALVNFPAYIRLEGANFPKGVAKGGSDLRVVNNKGQLISFEITNWDSIAHKAALWVKLDTLLANDSAQSVTLRWGNPYLASRSSGASVFDTIDWCGVWHLDHIYRDRLNRPRFPDATAFAHDGILSGYQDWETTAPLGNALTFDGITNKIAMLPQNLDMGKKEFTLQVWVRDDAIGSLVFLRGHNDTIWNHHERALLLGIPSKPSSVLGWYPGLIGWGNPNVYATAETAIDSSKWDLLTIRHTMATVDSGDVQWFFNGQPMVSNSSRSVLESDDPTDSLFLAGYWGSKARRFTGSMQELQIAHVARSTEWIHMSAFNQIPTNSWMQFIHP